MISIEEIDKTILDLENHDTTYATCEKLAWLYTVRDHLTGNSVSHETTPVVETSEFTQACSGVDLYGLLVILDEHMEAIKALYPKEYTMLVQKIQSLH